MPTDLAPPRPLRVVQWTTGNVARQLVPAMLARPDLDLVGVYAHSEAKVGRDLADLVGLPEPTGVVATADVDALLDLRPDCIAYTALHVDVDEVVRFLAAGINVVTTSEFMTGRGLGAEATARIEEAAQRGGASIFGSGMNPGFAQLLAGVASGISTGIRHVRVSESVDTSLFAGDSNFDAMGWGRPAGDPGHAAAVEAATAVFADAVDVLAALLGVADHEPRCTVTFAHATADLDLPGRPIAAGTVAGIDVRWEATVDGRPVIEVHQRWVMGRQLDPAWTVEHGYLVEVAGDPRIRLKLDIWPDTDDLSTLDTPAIHGIGMRITALPVVNAIPAVCAAAPGIRTYADLPTIAGRLVV